MADFPNITRRRNHSQLLMRNPVSAAKAYFVSSRTTTFPRPSSDFLPAASSVMFLQRIAGTRESRNFPFRLNPIRILPSHLSSAYGGSLALDRPGSETFIFAQ